MSLSERGKHDSGHEEERERKMKRIYICMLCDWKKISEDILAFYVHASTDHRDFFFLDAGSKWPRRNKKRLRDYVSLEPITEVGSR